MCPRSILLQISKRLHFLGITGRVFFKIDKGKVVNVFVVDGDIRTHDPKTHGLSTTSFVKELVGF